MRRFLDQRPLMVAVAGPNGAGKTTFIQTYLRPSGFRSVNADDLARELRLDPVTGAAAAAAIRQDLVEQKESFIFETVFSDPVGEKLTFMKDAVQKGYTVVLCFIGLADATLSDERVAMRVSQGGHDVPPDKLITRFPRVLRNLQAAIRELPHVLIFDNSDLRKSFHQVAEFHDGHRQPSSKRIPDWLAPLLPDV